MKSCCRKRKETSAHRHVAGGGWLKGLITGLNGHFHFTGFCCSLEGTAWVLYLRLKRVPRGRCKAPPVVSDCITWLENITEKFLTMHFPPKVKSSSRENLWIDDRKRNTTSISTFTVEAQEKLTPPEEIKPQLKYASLKGASWGKWPCDRTTSWHHPLPKIIYHFSYVSFYTKKRRHQLETLKGSIILSSS